MTADKDSFFVSGPFTGASAIIRVIVNAVFAKEGHKVIEKNGSVPEPVCDLVENANNAIFILGGTHPAIEDIFGRTLVEMELAYIGKRAKPLLPIMLKVGNEENCTKRLLGIRKSIVDQYGDKVIWVDDKTEEEILALRPTEADLKAMRQAFNDFEISDTKLAVFYYMQALPKFTQKLVGLAAGNWKAFAKPYHSRKVFISYSNKDAHIADGVHDALIKQRLIPWVDRYQIQAGQVFSEKIQKAIEMSAAVVVLLSKNSVQSNWVRKELALAVAYIKETGETEGRIIPVRIDDVELPEDLAFLNDLHRIDLFGGRQLFMEGIQKLAVSIRSIYEPDAFLNE